MADASPPRDLRARLRRGILSSGALAVLALAALVVMSELDRLIADVLTPSGRAHALSAVIGPGAILETEAWSDWAAVTTFPVGGLIVAHVIVDLAFIACYATLLLRLVRGLAPRGSGSRRLGIVLVAVLAGADLLEDAAVTALALTASASGGLVGVQLAATALKWIAALATAGYLLLGTVVGDPVRRALGRGWRGLYAQRLVAIVVAAVAGASLVPADGVFEQLSDVYRSWIGYAGLALGPLAAALAAFAITGTGLLWLARGRARRYARSAVDARPQAPLAPWLAVAAAFAVVGVALGLAQNRAPADWLPLVVFLLAILAVVGVSTAARRWPTRFPAPPALRPDDLHDEAPVARQAGDALLACWIVLAGLGPFKAFVAPIALEATGAYDASRFAGSLAGTSLLAAGFLALAVAGMTWFRRWAARDRPREATGAGIRGTLAAAVAADRVTDAQQRLLVRLGFVVLGVSGAVVIAFLLLPMALSAALGPAAVLVLLVGAWVGILGWLTLTLGRYRPLEVFRLLRLRSAPVVTLLVVLPIVASSVQNAPGLHAVRFASDEPLPDRAPLAEAYSDWYAGDSCALELGEVPVKPLVLVSAEGGGIRAATWTVDVLRELPRASGCAASAVFASSGASGGSVGLASMQRDGSARVGADASTIDFAGTDALAADLAALLGGDLVGAVTGIRVPSAGLPHGGGWEWRDRTALQEETWEAQAPQFAEPFDATPDEPTGYLVMNSTDSASLCKVLVSQLDLTAGGWSETDGTAGAASPDCSSDAAELPATIDLLDYLGACERGLSWATAAELSARFPYVSPAGRIANATLPAGCRTVADLQLVDGGTTDNSALGTWVDLAPQLTALIRATNAEAAATGEPYVLPIVLFATNEPGSDVLLAPDGTRPEALVPLAAIFQAKGAQTSPATWLRRASDAYAAACPAGDTACTEALAALRRALPGGVVVASPSTTPAVSVPLGWSLSSFSRSRLRFEAEGQAVCGRDPAQVHPEVLAAHAGDPCRASGGYGMLGELLDQLGEARPAPVP